MLKHRNKASEDIWANCEQTQPIAQEEYRKPSAGSWMAIHAICYLHCQGKCLVHIYKMTHYMYGRLEMKDYKLGFRKKGISQSKQRALLP